MKKIFAVLAVCAAAALLAGAVPEAVESAVPASKTLYASTRSYYESVSGSGSLRFLGERDVTSAFPLVLGSFCVGEGDRVEIGDRIATVDREATATLIQSLGQVSQLAVAAADLSTAVALIPSEVTATAAGRVISVAGNGASVESGYSIATIAATDELAVMASISELDIAQVQEGQRVLFSLAAYPDEVFSGTVSHIAAAARNQYNGAVLETVVDITVKPDEADPRLKSGLSADVEVMLTEPRQICVLPYEAIAQDEGGEYIYVYENGAAVRRNIFTGAEFSDGAQVLKGVSAGETVLADPEEIAGRSFIRVDEKEQGSNE